MIPKCRDFCDQLPLCRFRTHSEFILCFCPLPALFPQISLRTVRLRDLFLLVYGSDMSVAANLTTIPRSFVRPSEERTPLFAQGFVSGKSLRCLAVDPVEPVQTPGRRRHADASEEQHLQQLNPCKMLRSEGHQAEDTNGEHVADENQPDNGSGQGPEKSHFTSFRKYFSRLLESVNSTIAPIYHYSTHKQNSQCCVGVSSFVTIYY